MLGAPLSRMASNAASRNSITSFEREWVAKALFFWAMRLSRGKAENRNGADKNGSLDDSLDVFGAVAATVALESTTGRAGRAGAEAFSPHHVIGGVDRSISITVGCQQQIRAIIGLPHRVVILIDDAIDVVIADHRIDIANTEDASAGAVAPFAP